MTLRTYDELVQFRTFEERFDYLSLKGQVGESTFGFDRWMNQAFYRSHEWRRMRDLVILRDQGCDLAFDGRDIHDRVIIHHMNPMRAHDLIQGNRDVLDLKFLITTTHRTHNAIHYGDAELLPKEYVPRRAGDTKLW